MAARAGAYLEKLFGLTGQVALVTGGSSGIGFAMASALGQAGALVILVARRPAPLLEAETALRRLDVVAHSFRGDMSDRSDVQSVVDRVRAKFGIPNFLVNAAGINYRPPLSDVTEESWDATLAANLTGPFLLGQAFGPEMAERGSGRIINVVSQQAFRAFGNSGVYGVSKAGLVALTRSQAEAWSPRGVLCNAVAPGVVRTALTEAVFADEGKAEAHARRTMIGRNGVPDDFEGVVVYLASRASDAVTGQTIFVDGGYSST